MLLSSLHLSIEYKYSAIFKLESQYLSILFLYKFFLLLY